MKKIVILPSLIALLTCSCSIGTINSNASTSKATTNSATSSDQTLSSNLEQSSNEQTPSSQEPISSPSFLEDYSLYWSDEFNGTSLNTANWEPQIGDGTNYNVYRWGNNEQQYYKSENAIVRDGELHIIAKKEQTIVHADENDVVYDYTSARLRTIRKVTTLYGYIEARIKLPAGVGLWPAFWMLPEDSYEGKWWPTNGEIDIMEARGRILNKYGATIHTGTSSGQDSYKNKDYTFSSSEEDITGYHRYGCEWSMAGFSFYIDDYKFFEVTPTTYKGSNSLYSLTPTAPFDQPFHLLLNLAIGGQYDNNRVPEDSFTQAEMLVDYVRIYHKN